MSNQTNAVSVRITPETIIVHIYLLPSSVPIGNCNCNWTEFSLIITVWPPTQPPTKPDKYHFKHFSTNVYQVSIQEYIRSQIGRRPQLFKQMEDDHNCYANGRWPQLFMQIKDDIIFWGEMENEINLLRKWKMTSIL